MEKNQDPKMRVKQKQARVTLSVERGVGLEFSLQAGRVGKSLHNFASEWLTTASRISAEGGTAERALEGWEVASVFKDVEVVPLPADFVEQLIEGLCSADTARALRSFGELGERIVKLLKVYAPDIDQLADLARGFTGVAALKRLELRKVGDDSLALNVVGAGKKLEVTECAYEFARAVLAGYGYQVTNHDIGVGTIRAVARRGNQLAHGPDSGPG